MKKGTKVPPVGEKIMRKKRKEMLRHLMTEEESARWNPE